MSNNDGVGPGGKGDKTRPTDKKKFDEIATKAKEICPISKLLNAKISLTSTLE